MSNNRDRQARQSPGRPGGQRRPSRAAARRPRPLPQGNTLFTPDASAARRSIEQRSATSLLWLHQMPAWLLPLLAVVLLIAGLAVGGAAGAIALAGVAVALSWLAALSWPRLSAQGRLLRVASIAVILTVAIIRAVH